jgi:CubicO group peptidase (beta-lactamase class C family)
MNKQLIQQILNNALARGEAPGIAAAVTGPSGTLLEAFAGPNINRDTLFWIASMTKPVTSVAAMQLVENGTLTLDSEMGDLLPELKNPQILENNTLRPATRKITLRHLLTHTAGYAYPFMNPAFAAFIAQQDPKTLPEIGTRAALNAPLMFEPGTAWEYGFSTDWLGLAVEAASGLTLDKYFQTHIFAPLGMEDTTFTPTPAQIARQAPLHQRLPDDTLRPKGPAKPFAQHFCSGGGGLFSTLADYQKFLRIFLAPSPILSPASIAAMSTNQIGPLTAGYMGSADPAQPGINVNPGQDNKFGLGFLIYPGKGPFGRSPGSLTWSGLPNTYFWIDPEINLAAIILMQILPAGDTGAIKTYSRFEKAVYAAPQPAGEPP